MKKLTEANVVIHCFTKVFKRTYFGIPLYSVDVLSGEANYVSHYIYVR